MRKLTLTNEIDNIVKGSVVMTPGYASDVKIIGVSSSTVLQTPTQEAPLSKTSAFVKPETIAQSAEKVLNSEAIVGTQAQNNEPVQNVGQNVAMPNIFPQVATQEPSVQQNYKPVIENQQAIESVPVQVASPETLNTLVTPQFEQTMGTFETTPEVATPETSTHMEQNASAQEIANSNNNAGMSENQYTPSQEIISPVPAQSDNNFAQTNQYPEQPPVLPTEFAKSENSGDHEEKKNETQSKIVSLLKEIVLANIETNKKMLEKIEKIETELKKTKNRIDDGELTTNNVVEPVFEQTPNNTQAQYNVPNLVMPSNEGTNVYTMHM